VVTNKLNQELDWTCDQLKRDLSLDEKLFEEANVSLKPTLF
jgi:hypothetical protein